VALSSPSFELWLLLHFQQQNAHIERDALRHQCTTYLAGYSKRITEKLFTLLAPRYSEALRRARELDAWHDTRGTAGANPSTAVYKLAQRLDVLVSPTYR
jgi:hypothetical protein